MKIPFLLFVHLPTAKFLGFLMGFNPIGKGDSVLTIKEKIEIIIMVAPYIVLFYLWTTRHGRRESK
jgi:hypothetical protein